ncbi:MAG: cytidylate kinase family protein [Treponema sp.]|nr:cytidylate kinase family protein [Treponema sp.]
MKKDIRIAISGRSGCGNTTISKMLADTLNLRFINFTFRSLAIEHNIDLKKILELAASDDFWDKEVDTRQVKIAREEGGCVLGSRLAIWMLNDADLKVYLNVSHKVRVERIVEREGGNHAEVSEFTVERDKQDHDRYLRIYGINTDDYSFADLIVDADNISPQEITGMIISKIKEL